jgi:hypothetical protein
VLDERPGYWEVDHVAPSRLLALRYWSFEVESLDPGTSRLHVKTHGGDPPLLAGPVIPLLFEPSHFIMERPILLGIKERAERLAARRQHLPPH